MHKKIFITAIVLAFFLPCICRGYSGGSGEPNDPYQISAVADWQQLMNTSGDWNKHFILTADLDLQGVALTPVGSIGQGFSGVCDGNGHIIRNAGLDLPDSDYIDLGGGVRQCTRHASFFQEYIYPKSPIREVDLKVDLALPIYGPRPTVPIAATAKPGWCAWAAWGWCDMSMHDFRVIEDIDGTGVSAAIAMTVACSGHGGLKVKGMCMGDWYGGDAPTGIPQGDPIANSWFYHTSGGGNPRGNPVLLLYGLPAGEYTLTSYHNFWIYCSDKPEDRWCTECEPNMPPMPRVWAIGLADVELGDKNSLVNAAGDCLGNPAGVELLEDAYNIKPTHTLNDDEVATSEISFRTDGSAVLVIYEAPHNWTDPRGRDGGRGILNAFELRGGCSIQSWSFDSDFQYNLDDTPSTVEGTGHLLGTATLSGTTLSIDGQVTFNGPLPAQYPQIDLIATDGPDRELAQQIISPYYFSYSEVAPNTYQFSGTIPNIITPINNGHYEASILVPYGAEKYHFLVNTDSLISEYYFPLTKYLVNVPLFSPNGGEALTGGRLYDIRWSTREPINNISIEYSTDGGNTWELVESNLSNRGSYSWRIPRIVSNQYRVRVSDAADPTIFGTSGVFTVNVNELYIHQCYDTPDDFRNRSCCGSSCGQCACGATSTVMLLAALGRISPWPCLCKRSSENGCWSPEQEMHSSDYGNYVCREYTYAGETWGDDKDGAETWCDANGAFGYTHGHTSGYCGSIPERRLRFLYLHGVRGNGSAWWDDGITDAPTEKRYPDAEYVRTELRQGHLVIGSTELTSKGHIVLIIGYDANDPNLFYVNDPWGDASARGYLGLHGNDSGKNTMYTWDQMHISGHRVQVGDPNKCVEQENTTPPEPSSLKVSYPNGDEIPLGGWTLWPSVTFEGTVKDVDSPQGERDSVQLEIELTRFHPLWMTVLSKVTYKTGFTKTPDPCDIKRFVPDLSNGIYRWRARTVDIRDANSPWVNVGNNGSLPDFMVVRVFKLVNLIDDILGGDGSENSQRPKAMGESAGQSPANMVLTDPTGAIVSMDAIEIPGAIYEEVDIDGDGDLDDLIAVPEDKIGNYVIKVIPESGTSADDTFSFQVEENGESIVLAENTKFSDAPAEGYVFESKLCNSDLDTDGAVDFVDYASFASHWMADDCNYPGWCEGSDLNYDHKVDLQDLMEFAENWLWEKIPGDLDMDSDVDFVDFAALATHWLEGNCAEKAWCEGADLDKSGSVDLYDLAQLAANWLAGR